MPATLAWRPCLTFSKERTTTNNRSVSRSATTEGVRTSGLLGGGRSFKNECAFFSWARLFVAPRLAGTRTSAGPLVPELSDEIAFAFLDYGGNQSLQRTIRS